MHFEERPTVLVGADAVVLAIIVAWLGLALFQDYAALCTTCHTPD